MPVARPVVDDTDPFLIDPHANDPAHSFDVPLAMDNKGQREAVLTQIADEVRNGTTRSTVPLPPIPSEQPSPESELAPEDQPETFDVDGGNVTISYDKKKGWTGTLELSDGGGTETFYGKTQKELITKVLTGKLNATKQIRKLNKKIKLGTPTDAPVQTIEPETFQPKQLDANAIFEIKTALEADPDKALELWFQKKFGLSAGQLVQIANEANARSKKGEEAYEELSVESVSKEFLENHKNDYTPYAENGQAIMHWLCKNKLRRNPRVGEDFGSISSELLKKGLYTVDNLEEAFEDLRDSGLLVIAPEPEIQTPEPAPVRQEEPVQPATQNPRIASERRQPRGGLGIRPGSVSPTRVEESRAPSADELDNMPTEQLRELLNKTYQHARSTRR